MPGIGNLGTRLKQSASHRAARALIPAATALVGSALGGPRGAAAGASMGTQLAGGTPHDAVKAGVIAGLGAMARPRPATPRPAAPQPYRRGGAVRRYADGGRTYTPATGDLTQYGFGPEQKMFSDMPLAAPTPQTPTYPNRQFQVSPTGQQTASSTMAGLGALTGVLGASLLGVKAVKALGPKLFGSAAPAAAPSTANAIAASPVQPLDMTTVNGVGDTAMGAPDLIGNAVDNALAADAAPAAADTATGLTGAIDTSAGSASDAADTIGNAVDQAQAADSGGGFSGFLDSLFAHGGRVRRMASGGRLFVVGPEGQTGGGDVGNSGTGPGGIGTGDVSSGTTSSFGGFAASALGALGAISGLGAIGAFSGALGNAALGNNGPSASIGGALGTALGIGPGPSAAEDLSGIAGEGPEGSGTTGGVAADTGVAGVGGVGDDAMGSDIGGIGGTSGMGGGLGDDTGGGNSGGVGGDSGDSGDGGDGGGGDGGGGGDYRRGGRSRRTSRASGIGRGYAGPVRGPGGGQDDVIPAQLSDGEHVLDADTVAAIGDGSNDEGHRRLEAEKRRLRARKRAAPANKIPPKTKGIGFLHGAMKRRAA